MTKSNRWAVIGGGMMGIALARRLAERQQSVTLIESRSTLGGLADAWKLGDVTWDRHYHVISLSDMTLRAELDELGLTDEIDWVETKTGFYAGGKFYGMSSSLEFLMFPPLRLIEKFRLGCTIFCASKIRNWKPLEKVLVADWLTRWSGASTFQKIWQPLLRAKLGDAYKRTAASFIWATINRMYRARRTGLKKEMFGYVKGGYARILQRCDEALRELGTEIKVDHKVLAVRKAIDGAGVEVEYASGEIEHFDNVIITAATHVVAKICLDLTPDEKRAYTDIEYLGIICASMLVRKPLRGFYVTNITDEVPFTAVIDMSTIVPPEELGGNRLVYLPKYVSQGDAAITMTDNEIQAEFISRFLQMYPELSESDIAAFRISRVRYVTAIPTLGYSERLAPVATSIPGVYAINSALITKDVLNVNETLNIANEQFAKTIVPVIDGAAPSAVELAAQG